MPELDQEQWVKDLIHDIAKDHKVLIDGDDPVLITAILNEKMVDKFLAQQQKSLYIFETNIEKLFINQESNNKELIKAISQKLIRKYADKPIISSPPLTTSKYSQQLIYVLLLILGILLGHIIRG